MEKSEKMGATEIIRERIGKSVLNYTFMYYAWKVTGG
jgi:hypothetical protein